MALAGQNLKYLRKLKGWTQEEFAGKLGIKRSLIGAYEAHVGFIDHPSHPETGASKRENDPYFRHNVRAYNAWAMRNGAGALELPARLPLIGASTSPITDYLSWAKRRLRRDRER